MRAAPFIPLLVVATACTPPPVEGCNSDAECSTGDVCISGACQPRPPPVCLADFHDGGDGRCVPVDECSEGFRRFFVDADGDAHGGTELGEDCAREAPAGFASEADDCDDDDPDRFVIGTFDFDRDGDGRSFREEVCVGNAPPIGALPQALPSSTLLVHPQAARVEGVGDSWNNPTRLFFTDGSRAEIRVRRLQQTTTLVLSGFGCSVPLTQPLSAVSLHLVGRASGNSGLNDAATILTVTNGVAQEIAESVLAWPTTEQRLVQSFQFTDGINAIDPCADDFSIGIAFRGIELDKDLQIDEVYIEAFGVEDCDDDNSAVYMPLNLHIDGDGDGAGGPAATLVCVTSRDDVQGHVRTIDCDDDDINARPGQTQAFTVPRAGVGGFDYDCDGVETAIAITQTGCTDDPLNGCTANSIGSTTGACGQDVAVQRCDTGSCTASLVDITQACR